MSRPAPNGPTAMRPSRSRPARLSRSGSASDAGLALVVDVRQDDQWAAGHVPAALNDPLHSLPRTELPTEGLVLAICRSG